MSEYDFHDPKSMLSIANDPSKVARADTKSLYCRAEEGENDVENIMAQLPGEGSAFLKPMDGHVAVFNPRNGRIFDVATDEYQPIQPPEFIGPLAAELNERDLSITGSYSMFDGGGRGYLEVLTAGPDTTIWPEDRSGAQEPVRSGTTVSWSHDGGVSVKARAFAQDGRCKNTMRSVSDAIYVKHAGEVEERVDWRDEWAGLLDSLGAFSAALESVIGGAIEHVLFDLAQPEPFSRFAEAVDIADWRDATNPQRLLVEEVDVPAHMTQDQKVALNGFFDLLGFPGYICRHATKRLMFRLQQKDAYDEVTAWDAYSAATYALSHEAQFAVGGSSDREYHRTASEILSNPPLVMDQAERELRARVATDDTDEAAIDSDLGDAARVFKQREEEMQQAISSD